MTFPTSHHMHRSIGLRRNRPLHYHTTGNVLFETETETVHTLHYPHNYDYDDDYVATMNRPNNTNNKTQLHNKKPPRAASTSALPSTTKALSLSSSTASAPTSTFIADSYIKSKDGAADAFEASAGRDPCPPPLSLSESMSSMGTGITFSSSSDEMSATAELGLHEQHQQIFRSLSSSSSSVMEDEDEAEDENDFRVLKRANPVYDSDDEEDYEDPDYYSYGVPSASKRARHVVNNEQRVTLLEDGSFSLAGLWRPSA